MEFGQIIATSHDLTLNGGLVREIPLFQKNAPAVDADCKWSLKNVVRKGLSGLEMTVLDIGL